MKTKKKYTHPLYESPMKERNEEKYGMRGDGNQCICCYKPMKDGEVKMVHMNTNWEAVSNEVPEEKCKEMTGAESQGCFPIGNDCAKKMPKEFIIEPTK